MAAMLLISDVRTPFYCPRFKGIWFWAALTILSMQCKKENIQFVPQKFLLKLLKQWTDLCIAIVAQKWIEFRSSNLKRNLNFSSELSWITRDQLPAQLTASYVVWTYVHKYTILEASLPTHWHRICSLNDDPLKIIWSAPISDRVII